MNLLFEWQFWLVFVVGYPCIHAVSTSYRSITFGVLSVAGIWLLAGGSTIVVALGIAGAFWCAGQAIKSQNKNALYFLVLGIIVLLLVAYKVALSYQAIAQNFTAAGSLGHSLFTSMVILGFSYSGLRGYDLIRSVKSGSELLNPLALFGYLFPLHSLVAGPICLYDKYLVINKEDSRTDYPYFLKGVNWVTTGLFYKIVIAESIRILAWGVDGKISSDGLIETAIIFVYLFFDFAGYSYVAFGLGYLLAVPTPLNFRTPFIATSITDFWTRWHISLGDFVRKSIYFPCQVYLVRRFGVKFSGLVAFFTLVVSFTLVGLWHQPTVNFLIWGSFLGLLMGFEKVIRENKKFAVFNDPSSMVFAKKVIGPIYVFVMISCSLHIVINDVL